MRMLLGLVLTGLGFFSVGNVWSFRPDDDKATKSQRFDLEVREDLFSGFAGDEEALKRGLAKCEEALKKDPKHAEAMVWRGAGRVFLAGNLFRDKKQAEAIPLWTAGLADMDNAVKLEPKNVGVRIPRASVLVPAARNTPPVIGKPLLEKAMDDFQTIYEQQKDHLDSLGSHPRGELRMGLADVYRLMGKADQSKEQLEAVIKELPDSKYSARAKEWLAAKPEAKLAHNCIGCHRK